jgi:CubicO group peptidase (beta-lactamase class C family)
LGDRGWLRSRLRREVDSESAPGPVAMVARGVDVETAIIGKMAFDAPAPMRRDTIFRIASMTKPISVH